MAKRRQCRQERAPASAEPAPDVPPVVALAVSRPEDLEPLGRPDPRLRASAVIDGVTAAAYVVARSASIP